MQPGREQVAAGYVVYGPQTMLVLTLGDGVLGFTLEPDSGEWVLTHDRIAVPAETKEFAINASNQRHWHRAGAALHRRLSGGHDRAARQGFQHALGGVAWWRTCTAS